MLEYVVEFRSTQQMPTYHSLIVDATDGQQFLIPEQYKEYVQHLLKDYPQNWFPVNKEAKDLSKSIKGSTSLQDKIMPLNTPRRGRDDERLPIHTEQLPPPTLPAE